MSNNPQLDYIDASLKSINTGIVASVIVNLLQLLVLALIWRAVLK